MSGPASPLAVPLDLGPAPALDDERLAALLDPRYREPLGRVPRGDIVSRGLPFRLGRDGAGPRWLALDRVVEVPVRPLPFPGAAASGVEPPGAWPPLALVLLAFCDAWRDAEGRRPPATPIGWVVPVGEPLARVTVTLADGRRISRDLRRRFEVNEGIVGWGSGAFRALPHRPEGPLDPRGPHPRQAPGRLAPVGHAGPMTVLPGGWGAAQTGVEDHVPSATDDLMLWLHEIPLEADADAPRSEPRSLQLEPLPGEGLGRMVVVAAVTAWAGRGPALRWAPRRSLRVEGARDLPVAVDLGLVARRRPLARPPRPADDPVPGWGLVPAAVPDAEEVEVTAAADARLRVGSDAVPLAEIPAGSALALAAGARIEALPPAERRLALAIVDGSGAPAAARVRCTAADGRPLPPAGHRDEVNPGIYEDAGADLLLAGAVYAYVDGTCTLEVPADGALLEVVAGPERPAIRLPLDRSDLDRGTLRLTLDDPLAPAEGRWVTGDTHVHFLSPSTALLQARAEGVNVVHLLATGWGDLVTGLTDVGGDQATADGRHAVWVGSENRQALLGHVGLVGGAAPHLPFASGGPPEGRLGGAVRVLLADWLRRCRAGGGLAIGAHFPLPLAEVVADIAAGLLDALEIQVFDPTLEAPPIREWYRLLDAGYDLPLVAGTDRMSAEVPLGQVRTWARLDDDVPLGFESWARAIRAGRTVVTAGPILELRVDGSGPGDRLTLGAGTRVDVELEARAPAPVVGAVELVQDGRVVAGTSSPAPTTRLLLRERIRVDRSGWVAGRSRSPHAIGSAFGTSLAAHTSAVRLDVAGRPRAPGDLRVPLTIVDGTRTWLREVAPIADPGELERMVAFLDEAEARLRARAGHPPQVHGDARPRERS